MADIKQAAKWMQEGISACIQAAAIAQNHDQAALAQSQAEVARLRQALQDVQKLAVRDPHPREVTKHDCTLCKIYALIGAALSVPEDGNTRNPAF